jgi:ABC-type transporter Mla subunit MlaD
MKPRNFEEALDQLADDNRALWDALDNIVTLWDALDNRALRDALDNIVTLWGLQASIDDIENSMGRARALLCNTAPEEETK